MIINGEKQLTPLTDAESIDQFTKLKNYVDTIVTDTKEFEERIEKSLRAVEVEVATLDESVSGVIGDVSDIQATINEIVTDISGVKTDVATLSTSVQTVQDDMRSLTETLSAFEMETNTKIENLQSDLGRDVQTLNARIEHEVGTINNRIDNEVLTIDGKIDTEIADRQAGDTALDEKIDTEVATINNRINTEIATINTSLDEKQNKTLSTPLPLPLGTQTDVEGALQGLSIQEQTDTTNLASSIAPDFSESVSYAVGDYVLNQKILYKCKVAHTGAWNNADFELVKIVNELGGSSPAPVSPVLYDYIITNQTEFANWIKNNNNGTETVAIVKGNYTIAQADLRPVTNETNRQYGIMQPKLLDCYGDVVISITLANRTATYGVWGGETPDVDSKINGLTVNVQSVTHTLVNVFKACRNLTKCKALVKTGNIGRGFYECNNVSDCEVEVESTGTSSGNTEAFGFSICKELENCSAVVTANAINSNKAYGFFTCEEIENCNTRVTATGGSTNESYGYHTCNNLANCIGSGIDGSKNGYGFTSCNNLTNCKGSGNYCGFENCKNLTSCTGSSSVDDAPCYAFRLCDNLSNCSGVATSSGASFSYSFANCNNLNNCNGSAEGGRSGSGFRDCNNLASCTGSGVGTNYGWGFYFCTSVFFCKASAKCTTVVFDDTNCSFSPTYQAQYKCANTLEGGWNDTTNPAA